MKNILFFVMIFLVTFSTLPIVRNAAGLLISSWCWLNEPPYAEQLQLTYAHVDIADMPDLDANGIIFGDELNIDIYYFVMVDVTMRAVPGSFVNMTMRLLNFRTCAVSLESPNITVAVTPNEYESYVIHEEHFYNYSGGTPVELELPILMNFNETVVVKEHMKVSEDCPEAVTVNLLLAYYGSAQRKLTVYSAHDSPSPPNGDYFYDDGQSVTCSVSSPVTEGGTVWTCTGWTGTGSVPSSGTNSSATFTITLDSSITWNWQGQPVNNPPSTPSTPFWTIAEKILRVGEKADFGSSATDPDSGDQVEITFDWGDGNNDTSSFVSSGTTVRKDHYWSRTGMFKMKTKAIDTHGAESGWSASLEVTVVSATTTLDGNWSGYVLRLKGPVVTLSVRGKWTYPSYSNSPLFGSQGTWVGIGGVGDQSNFLQVGIATDYPLVTRILPFYEIIYPGHKNLPVFGYEHWNDVSPGDLIEAGITQMGIGQWQVYVKDLTRGWTWMPQVVEFQPDTTYVEWIHEPGASGSGIADFGSINFQSAEVTVNAITYKAGNTDSNLQSELIVTDKMRGSTIITTVMPIRDFDKFTIIDTGQRPTALSTVTSLSLHSSANLVVSDSKGNRDGYNTTTGLVDIRIPESTYFQDQDGSQWIVLYGSDSYEINVVGISNGDYHLHAQIVSNQTILLDQWINETILVDETKTYSLTHEISLGRLENQKTVIGEGYSNSISVMMTNDGNYTESFNVGVYANATIINQTEVTLIGGKSEIMTFTWNTSGFVKGNYTIWAYAWPVSGETDTADNKFTGGVVTVTILGDLDGDFAVQLVDLVTLARAYGSKPGELGWNPNADLDDNGIVGLTDLVIMAKNYGKTDP